MNTSLIILVAVVGFVGFVVFTFNSLIRGRNRVKEAWADIEVQLKRRYNLIPNLVEAVKGYMGHERDTLAQLTEMRAKAMQGGSLEERGQTENMITDALKSVFALSENYPQLRASENFTELQRELTDTENKIQASRRFYNGTVRDFNTAVQSFPQNIIAGMFNFKEREFFELGEDEEAAKDPVKIEF